ncbi:MAG: SRPBCC family protein [Chloroflexi bacterium]|nr:SRPBCC family protein [Chloroflexota bacterium]MCI0575834.1 SRPBCC family protein [Chloroflexota bacterium]MCI0646561.1 SRPBCC family protein [Chloroflexota bacterium]MCI0726363.1 SRPBCC family protein [Chloroflexota bacterium]
MNTIQYALQKIGIQQPTWQTVVVSAAKEVALPRELLWDTWAKLEEWPQWSVPLHLSTRWIGEPGWRVGATFEQVLNLGFPLGQTVSSETIGAVVDAESVSWWKDAKGIKSCHIWEFAALAPDRTQVTNTELFHGVSMGLLKPFAARNWQRMFEASVVGLGERAQQGSHGS